MVVPGTFSVSVTFEKRLSSIATGKRESEVDGNQSGVARKLQELRETIESHNFAYYVLNDLDLGTNGIEDEGAAAIAKALEVNAVLNTLYIGNNR